MQHHVSHPGSGQQSAVSSQWRAVIVVSVSGPRTHPDAAVSPADTDTTLAAAAYVAVSVWSRTITNRWHVACAIWRGRAVACVLCLSHVIVPVECSVGSSAKSELCWLESLAGHQPTPAREPIPWRPVGLAWRLTRLSSVHACICRPLPTTLPCARCVVSLNTVPSDSGVHWIPGDKPPRTAYR